MSIDALIVTALKDEYDAAYDVALRSGVTAWHPRDQHTPSPYVRGHCRVGGRDMSIALAWSTRMGPIGTSPVVASLVERLRPTCLAMCGVCAGNPSDVALGDVIIAELAWANDEGKRTEERFEADYRPYSITHEWLLTAKEIEAQYRPPSYGPPSAEDTEAWILEQLAAERNPRTHPALRRYVTSNEEWARRLDALAAAGWLTRIPGGLELTAAGHQQVAEARFRDLSGPDRLPLAIKVGPMTSGGVVVKDGRTWDELKVSGIRTAIGLDMESAVIATTAYVLQVKQWAVVKGVMDYADPRKDDRYKGFAARASSEVLLELLRRSLIREPPRLASATLARFRRVYVIGGTTGSGDESDVAEIGRELGDVIALADVDLVVCSPFEDSIDANVVCGYLLAGGSGTIHFHSPRHAGVEEQQAKLLATLPHSPDRIQTWRYPGPEGGGWSQAWLLCQLQALEHADVLIGVGGRVNQTAATLLHLAEARRIPTVPLAFLGGASAVAYERRNWDEIHPGVPHELLTRPDGVAHVMDIANALVSEPLARSEEPEKPVHTLFISRAAADHEYGEALGRALRVRGYDVRIGDNEVRADRLAVPAIEDALLGADLAIVLWSRAYALSPFCSDELDLALQRSGVRELRLWLCNLDSSDVVPRAARRIPQAVTSTPDELVDLVVGLLEAHAVTRSD